MQMQQSLETRKQSLTEKLMKEQEDLTKEVKGKLDAGHYVNFIFEATPVVLEKLRAKFKLDAEVYRQGYTKLGAKKVTAKAA